MQKNMPADYQAASTDGVMQEPEAFNRGRVTPAYFLPARYYAGAYAGEHVAGGEFVIGAAIAAWGASPRDVMLGLLVGNTLAVLSWALICSPVATRARITLYYYLERMAGRKLTQFYNVLNGAIMAIIAGGMITISASAVRVWTSIPAQLNWYPTSALFVVIACVLGALTIYVTVRGFAAFSQFAAVCAPWIITLFIVMAIVSAVLLLNLTQQSAQQLPQLFAQHVWNAGATGGSRTLTLWEIAAFAWGLNVPLHLGMGDLSTLRFARKWTYGFNTIYATFGGHFLAWICASMLGATTAMLLGVSIESLDIGGIVAPVLSSVGLVGIILACLTTAVPSLYRAGLAFHSLVPRASRVSVTLIVGLVTTGMACFPLLFLRWLDLMAYFNILMAPIGAVIIAEHFVLPQLGIAPFWRERRQLAHNVPAILTWILGTLVAIALGWAGLHLFYLFIPVIAVCLVFYSVTAVMGCRHRTHQPGQGVAALYARAYGEDAPARLATAEAASPVRTSYPWLRGAAWCMLLAMVACAAALCLSADPLRALPHLHKVMAALSLLYFALSVLRRILRARQVATLA